MSCFLSPLWIAAMSNSAPEPEPEWSPEDIASAGWMGWYDVTTSRTTAGGVVSALQNKVADSRHLAAAGGSPDLVSFRNGLEAVAGGGTKRLMGAFGATFSQVNAIYCFGTWSDNSSSGAAYDGDDGAARHILYQSGTPYKPSLFAGSAAVAAPTAPFGLPFISRAIFNGASTSLRIEANGSVIVNATLSTPGAQAIDGLTLLNNYIGGTPWVGGNVSGWLGFDSALSGEEDTQLMAWIRNYTDLPLV